jgi:hypothetical protein
VILLMLVGGPNQLETWDPKPDAPAEIRGPFRSIATNVAGVRINEHLPRLARRMDRLVVVRSMHRDAAPIHETGFQMLQTGRLCRLDSEAPHVGSVVARLRGAKNDLPPFVVLSGLIGNTGVGVSHGQSAGSLGAAFEPFHLQADPGAAGYDASRLFDRAQRFLDEAPDLSDAAPPRPSGSFRGRPGGPSSWAPSERARATSTAGTRSARAACWPAGWSRSTCSRRSSTR